MADTSLSVSRTIDAPTTAIWDLLVDPARHADFDGSGFVRSAEKPQPITAVGDVFRMNMEGAHMSGEYQMDNTVTGFVPHRLIAWQSAPAGTQPPGWEWMYELEADGSDATTVTLTYDWSKVTDKALLAKVKFPLVPAADLASSLDALASAVGPSHRAEQ
ncbi:uncharacterized protein YndB with AHSA1/START domain [Friedmanniella endophytica]|uniref:Uncharacterized protein YndB with AHSA1/START domain n=1 Tax=Microlunatus kandeliicorticis TaxID=1759536 RepID=A0A7W3IPS6_9ACTN|nr:SRPBCC family protein [Microlunatus kandeliicorticis]MBA8793001.1 uncharacterized protein YndB with AHSA1/START domain [Microlunatus kandeliicorticis]